MFNSKLNQGIIQFSNVNQNPSLNYIVNQCITL